MKTIFLAVVFSSFALTSPGAEPTAESVEKLFAVTKVEASLTAVRSGSEERMKAMIGQMLSAYPKNEKLRKVGDTLAVRVSQQFTEVLSWEKLKDDYIKLYQKNFTQEEVDAQIAFFETPVGKSVGEKTPGFSVESAQIIQAHYLPVLKDMQVAIKQELEKAMREK